MQTSVQNSVGRFNASQKEPNLALGGLIRETSESITWFPAGSANLLSEIWLMLYSLVLEGLYVQCTVYRAAPSAWMLQLKKPF